MLSSNVKYIGLDVHKEAISIAVLNGPGKLVMESIVETKSSTLLDFLHGLRGELQVTLEEGTWAAWLYDVLKPHVREIVICNPRRNALLKEGSKSDKIDARKLAELLRAGMLRAVYHGENELRTLRELARSYLTVSKDLKRVKNRLKALYRSWGISCVGKQVYTPRHREPWLSKIAQGGVRRRAELLYQQLDGLQVLQRTVRGELLAESRKHKAVKILRQVPLVGPLRAALLLALMQTPHRFRSKRQLWTYSGLAVVTHDSAQHRYVDGQLQRSKKPQQIRGLNQNHNHAMKDIFKSTALSASCSAGPLQDFYARLLAAVIDWFSRRVLSWQVSITMDTSFCVEALEEALSQHGKPEIFNTDQGSQFSSEAFTGRLKEEGIQISMDGKGRWADNVFVERLWRSLKYEHVYLHAYESVGDARRKIGSYFEFYNSRRPHSSLGAQTPDQVYFHRSPEALAA